MRALPILLAVFVTAAGPVLAQVTVDLHALEALPERPSAGQPTRSRPQAVPRPGPTVVTRVAPITPPPAASPTAPPQPLPALPQVEPQTASINPIAPPEPPAGSAPPPPPPVSATATTAAAPTTAGLRLTFAPEQSDLSPESLASIKQLATSAPPGDDTTFNVQAYAPGKPDDPSTARRVSLSRAMAVRAALVTSGVPSARIFVRALGEQYGDGPPDRVDIAVNGAPGAAAAK